MAVNENVFARPAVAAGAATSVPANIALSSCRFPRYRTRIHRFFQAILPEVFVRCSPLYSNMVRIHAIVMTAWVLLFAAQVWLVSAKRVRTHMKLGWAGVGLAVLILVTGYLVSIGGPSHLTAKDLGGIPPLSFMIIPLMDLVLFVLFFGGAIALRKKPAEHKRLMILVAANFLPPAAARMPIAALQALGPWWLFGFADRIHGGCPDLRFDQEPESEREPCGRNSDTRRVVPAAALGGRH